VSLRVERGQRSLILAEQVGDLLGHLQADHVARVVAQEREGDSAICACLLIVAPTRGAWWGYPGSVYSKPQPLVARLSPSGASTPAPVTDVAP
jgi:hypothetical protein